MSDTPLGLVPGLDIHKYHAGPGISKSGLDHMARSPAIYHALHLNAHRPAEIKRGGQLEGNLAHCALLEPEEFARRYVTVPSDAPRTPSRLQWAAKNPSPESAKAMDWWREFNARTGGAEIVTQEQHDEAVAQAASLRGLKNVFRDLSLTDLLSKGQAEVSAYWRDKQTGVLCRCRPDWVYPVNDRQVVILDVKTCGDAGPREFARQVARKRYHIQDPWYWHGFQEASGLEVLDFIFLAVESEWPHAAAPYRLDDEARNEGFSECRHLLDLYANCLKNNRWPGIAERTQTLALPSYALTPQEVEISYA